MQDVGSRDSGPEELDIPRRRIEDLESITRFNKQLRKLRDNHIFPLCLRSWPHEVEQRAHVPCGRMRPPARLDRRGSGSPTAFLVTRARWSMRDLLSATVEAMKEQGGVPTQG